MALKGEAFLAIWHDIAPEAKDEYTEWHTREHMPERLGIPGFIIGKRFVNWQLERQQIGTLYAGQSLEVFRSPAYLQRLNNPTDWSNRMQPAFRNFLRVACARVAIAGCGDGGAIATMRLQQAGSADGQDLRKGAGDLCRALHALAGVCAVHIGRAQPEVSGVKTRETELRPAGEERGFDVVVVIEGNGQGELEAILPQAEALVLDSGCGLSAPQSAVYALAYQLRAEEVQASQPCAQQG